MRFYVGLHQPADSSHFERAFISINRVRGRHKPVPCADWIMDSGAFREIEQFGGYRHAPAVYAEEVNRLAAINPGLRAAVSQDYMCEKIMLDRTGLAVEDHQRLTIERYDALKPLINVYLMPVLQGYSVQSYVEHLKQYGSRLVFSSYVGVGSVCKRNGDIGQIEQILSAIKAEAPWLKLHGFGLKTTALSSALVRELLESADSMAWSFAARKQGRDANSWHEAKRFEQALEAQERGL